MIYPLIVNRTSLIAYSIAQSVYRVAHIALN